MFRISQYMQEIAAPTPLGPKRNPPGPVVIWNLIRRCNLGCRHCYSLSADTDFAGELSTDEVKSVMEDLKEKVSKSRGKTPAAKPKRRVLTCTMEGLAPSDHDVFDFSQRLEEHSLFQQVLTDAQPSDAPGISHFTLSFQIDLETRYLFAEAPTEPVGGSQ